MFSIRFSKSRCACVSIPPTMPRSKRNPTSAAIACQLFRIAFRIFVPFLVGVRCPYNIADGRMKATHPKSSFPGITISDAPKTAPKRILRPCSRGSPFGTAEKSFLAPSCAHCGTYLRSIWNAATNWNGAPNWNDAPNWISEQMFDRTDVRLQCLQRRLQCLQPRLQCLQRGLQCLQRWGRAVFGGLEIRGKKVYPANFFSQKIFGRKKVGNSTASNNQQKI